MNAYIDVRGVWPILFVGFRNIKLVGMDRSITLKQLEDMGIIEPVEMVSVRIIGLD